jgi:hypothetical protein
MNRTQVIFPGAESSPQPRDLTQTGIDRVSFDLFLQRLENGISAEANRPALLAILRQVCPDPGDRFGFYQIEFSDGSHLEFSAKGLEEEGSFTGCAFHLRGFTLDIIDFVYSVATGGDLVIFNAQGGKGTGAPLTILVNESQRVHLPERLVGEAELCSSANHLAMLLGVTFSDWQSFRDQVVGRNSNKT